MTAKTTWILDPAHSEISFRVKHLMISNVKGVFTEFRAETTTEGDDFATASVTASINASSVNTGNADRDAHLRSADFFDTGASPEINFRSESFTGTGEGNFELAGELTIKGVTKRVVLEVEYGGLMKDPWGNVKAGFSVNGKINRKDFGLNWNAALETGGVLVSDEVKISAEVQFLKQS